ncbi:MAG: hypothetical protein DHS20C17_23950 [Cyclobacteriaceae bacterium]|nr:MAG: hypothetical protein DHS20C17_23950 [Cyclobacteriaceae bacterium]
MTKKLKLLLIFTILACWNLPEAHAQEALKPRPSPLEMVTMKYEDTYVKITYGRPHKRGRNIFGDLLPYGEVWRTGANEATEITITGTVKLGEHQVKPGTYTLFSIPEKDHWTIILNSELGQWGAYNYNAKLDVIRFDVPTSTTEEVYEPFTIEFEQKANSAELVMMWDNTKVAIPLEFM